MFRATFLLLLCAVLLPAETLTGKWNFVWQTPRGERTAAADLIQDGEKLELRMPNRPTFSGTVKEGRIELKGTLTTDSGASGEMTVSGTVENGGLKGEGNFAGQTLTFTATKAE